MYINVHYNLYMCVCFGTYFKSNIGKLVVQFFHVSTNISYVPYTTGESLLTVFENCSVSIYFHV